MFRSRAGLLSPSPGDFDGSLEIIPFSVDRPFIFLITDRKSGSILFMGRIQNPVE
jgi:serine protease inhibitor